MSEAEGPWSKRRFHHLLRIGGELPPGMVFSEEAAPLDVSLLAGEEESPALPKHKFRARAAQILQSYSVCASDGKQSYLQKLVHGMPRRLQRCKENNFGRCGK